MQTAWQALSAIGDSRFLLPLAAVVMLSLPAPQQVLRWRWATTIVLVALLTLCSKIAFMGWGIGIAGVDFTGISGHAAMSSTLYPVIFYIAANGRSAEPGRWAAMGALLAIAIGYSRLPLHAHSPSEVIAGLLLGMSGSAVVLRHAASSLHMRWKNLFLAAAVAALVPLAMSELSTHQLVEKLATALSGRESVMRRQHG